MGRLSLLGSIGSKVEGQETGKHAEFVSDVNAINMNSICRGENSIDSMHDQEGKLSQLELSKVTFPRARYVHRRQSIISVHDNVDS